MSTESPRSTGPFVGILALQGDVEKHADHLRAAGAQSRPVLNAADLEGLDAIVLPGGESTTMSHLLESGDLRAPLAEFMAVRPVLATCAGMILLAKSEERLPFPPFGLLDIDVARNAWGRQVFSFNEEIEWPHGSSHLSGNGDEPSRLEKPHHGDGGAEAAHEKAPDQGQGLLKAIFIRAPRVLRVGPNVEVLAELRGEAIAVRQKNLVALSFHPELTDDTRVHRWFVTEMLGR